MYSWGHPGPFNPAVRITSKEAHITYGKMNKDQAGTSQASGNFGKKKDGNFQTYFLKQKNTLLQVSLEKYN